MVLDPEEEVKDPREVLVDHKGAMQAGSLEATPPDHREVLRHPLLLEQW